MHIIRTGRNKIIWATTSTNTNSFDDTNRGIVETYLNSKYSIY
jgi:hypothetical protein